MANYQGGCAHIHVTAKRSLSTTTNAAVTKVAGVVLDMTARWVALAVVTLQSLLDLELIVFGGSIGVRPELYERVQRALPALFSRPIAIAPGQLGDRAGLVGAAWAAGRALREGDR